jgi:hypothetical protein
MFAVANVMDISRVQQLAQKKMHPYVVVVIPTKGVLKKLYGGVVIQ